MIHINSAGLYCGQGAVIGSIVGLVVPMWISIGAYSVVGQKSNLAFPTSTCAIDANSTMTTTLLATSTLATTTVVDEMYVFF